MLYELDNTVGVDRYFRFYDGDGNEIERAISVDTETGLITRFILDSVGRCLLDENGVPKVQLYQVRLPIRVERMNEIIVPEILDLSATQVVATTNKLEVELGVRKSKYPSTVKSIVVGADRYDLIEAVVNKPEEKVLCCWNVDTGEIAYLRFKYKRRGAK